MLQRGLLWSGTGMKDVMFLNPSMLSDTPARPPPRRHCHVEAKALLRICRSYKFEAGGRYLQKHMNILLLFFYEFKIINSSVPPCYIAS